MKKILILLVLLAVPSAIWLVMITGKNSFNTLAYFGPKDIIEKNGKVDTVYHKIPAFSFTNQYGETISDKDLDGKIYIADFFFTRCKGICLKMSTEMGKVQFEYKDDPHVVILSHTVDPAYDSVEVLMQYAQQYRAEKDKWHMVTGDKKELYDIARNGYLAVATKGDGGPEDFIHSQYFMLIDPNKHLRGIYDGTDPFEIDRLIDEIKVIKYEFQLKETRPES
ncbi:MAG: SCO family protein [Bacteroidia bacterium]|nr:SCO family protein [Bacteroidia bacterium]